jgi:CRISPR-associated endonuclease/helicase Cas3
MTFAQFFKAIWGDEPFPWQERLSELVLQGNWPASIGLPTAAGKTALIDIAVFALATGAPHAARRIFFVVDRRVIVDEAAERAAKLAKKLREAPTGSDLGFIAEALRGLGGNPDPLATAILRGGVARDDSWTDSPLQPVVICSTVDQVGSSLLFRAYGKSEYARPIRAGLAAYDSLIILDEAHTSQPFAETLGWIRKYRGWSEHRLNHPFHVVEMSATPRDGEVFREQGDDREHPVLKKRWEAEKRARLVVEDPIAKDETADGLILHVERLVQEARTMRDQQGAKVIGVVVNRVLTARRVHQSLAADEESDAILLTGRARSYDRDSLWNEWQPHIGMNRDREAVPEKPVFVVATQCIEVGANIDFDALVTEIASLDALEQRFGRLDRAGGNGRTCAVIVALHEQTKSKNEDPIYGAALSATWKWLKDQVITEERLETVPGDGKKRSKTKKVADKFVAMGVLALRAALEATEDRGGLTMPRRNAPVLMPAHVDLLCQTSPEPARSPEASIFLHGPETGPADVQVIWRQDLGNDSRLWADIVSVCPPSAAEAVSMPVWAIRRWLSGQEAPELADLEGTADENERVIGATAERPVLRWRGPDESTVLESAKDIRPGMTVIVPSSYGGCDKWGWNPASTAEVTDIGDPVKLRMNRPILRLHAKLVSGWNDAELARRLATVESVGAARAALDSPVSADAAKWVREAVSALRASRTVKLVVAPGDDSARLVAITGRSVFQQEYLGASYTNEIGLGLHLRGCRGWAEAFARDLPEGVRESVVRAAELHDIGKADPRFQAWLRGGNPIRPQELIAKSGRSGQNPAAIERARLLAGYPKGGRHELGSVALLEGREDEFAGLDFELLLHLIGSHHGRCRPFAPVVDDGKQVDIVYGGWHASSEHGLARAGSGVCERFWRLTRRYGWYGLCYLEALVRLADQRRSEAEQNEGIDAIGTVHA